VEGGASVVLEQLARLCGPLPDDAEQRIRRLPIDRLKELGTALFEFRSLQDMHVWLETHEKPTR
jgi:hypothetical protein